MIRTETTTDQITDEQCIEVINAVKTYLKDNSVRQSQVAKALCYSTPVISAVLAGKYAADHRPIIQAMDRWLERRRDADKQPETARFVFTEVARQIRLAAQRSIAAADAGIDSRISLVWGDPGCGKTMALQAIAQTEDGILITCGTDMASERKIIEAIAEALNLKCGRRSPFRAVVEKLRGSGKLILVDEIHALLAARDDKPFHALRRLSDEAGVPQLWAATCDLLEDLRVREQTREPLGQIIRRIGCQFHLTAGIQSNGGGGGGSRAGGDVPLYSIEEIIKIYGANELKLTTDAARFLARLCKNPKFGLLGNCTNLVLTATTMNRGKAQHLTAEMLWEAAKFLFQKSVIRDLSAEMKDEIKSLNLKIA